MANTPEQKTLVVEVPAGEQFCEMDRWLGWSRRPSPSGGLLIDQGLPLHHPDDPCFYATDASCVLVKNESGVFTTARVTVTFTVPVFRDPLISVELPHSLTP